jgi:hypothetical protein
VPAGLAVVAAHALSLWALLAQPLAERGVSPALLLAALAVVSYSLGRQLGGGRLDRGLAFLGAASPILPLCLVERRPPAMLLAAGIAWLFLPIAARVAASRAAWIAPALRLVVVTVLLPVSVTALASTWSFRWPTVVNLFEDGHGLLPASEYLRGELPYRDVVPGHGLAVDGLMQLLDLQLFGDDYEGLRRGEKITGALFWPALYALGYAATGSPTFGFCGALFSLLFFPQYAFTRATLSIATLALAVHAARTRSRRSWWVVGAAIPVSVCFAVDFAAYSAAGALTALWVARGSRWGHARRLALGAAVSACGIALVFGILGILRGFLVTTFVFVPSLLPAYAQGFPRLFSSGSDRGWTQQFPAEQVLLISLFVLASVVLLGSTLPRAPLIGQRARVLMPMLAWTVAAMMSVLERQHTLYVLLVVPVALLLLARWLSAWRPPWSPLRVASIGSLVVLALVNCGVVLDVLRSGTHARVTLPAELETLHGYGRARGALFRADEAALVRATAGMIEEAGFGPTDTWLDFANAPGLYYLLARDCPIRYYEVPFYESADAQREVIEAVEGNPAVKAVLMTTGLAAQAIDGIPNAVRAPRVAAFIAEKFRPFYSAGGVTFWIRRDGG